MFEKMHLEKSLWMAAGSGDLDVCQNLIEKQQININACDNNLQRTALHWAALYAQIDVVRYLVKSHAMMTEDCEGRTPYDLTTIPEIRRVLMYEGKGAVYYARVRITNASKDYLAYGYQYSNEFQKQIRCEIAKCNNLDQFSAMLSEYQLTPNSYIQGIPLLLLVGGNHMISSILMHYLLKNGTNINAQAHSYEHDAYESTALHALLACELVKKAKIFVILASKLGCNIDSKIQDVEGKTILHMGALLRSASFITLCLERLGSVAINVQDNLGRTPLHYAFLFGDMQTLEVLLEHGADPSMTDNQGCTPEALLKMPTREMQKALLRFHIDPSRSSQIDMEALYCQHQKMTQVQSSDMPTQSVYRVCVQNRIALLQALEEADSFFELYSPLEGGSKLSI